MTDDVAGLLAEHLLGWRATRDRYLTTDRGWLPRWRFQPCTNIQDAMTVLEAAKPQEYAFIADKNGVVWVTIRIDGFTGESRGKSLSLAICHALVRALGIDVDARA